MVGDRLGTPGNPVIGYPPPTGCRFVIVGKWPYGHTEDNGPETALEVLQLYERPAERRIVKMALRSVGRIVPDD
jgi:hypothetical protein